MYLFIHIHRLYDAGVLFSKSQFQIKNYIHSIDEFGEVDTLVMEDYFFMDNSFPESFEYTLNEEVFTQADLPLVLKVIDSSKLLR